MFEDAGNVLIILIVYGGVTLAAFWLAMIIWTYRDMRARSRDPLAQILSTVMVAVLTFPGLLIYLLLRPRETLSEAYERSLEEEALLQEIEEKPTCPGCGQRTEVNWQVCPQCHTRLKKGCISCGKMLDLSWNLCPYCATAQTNYETDNLISPYTPTTRRSRRGGEATTTHAVRSTSSESLEFVDGDEYQ